jgi:galactokinase
MTNSEKAAREIQVSAPGRICLFGEHQDYLRLPVITAAINLRVRISGYPRADQKINLELPDISATETIELSGDGSELDYGRGRDYFKSVINVLARNGARLSHGCSATIRGEIPIAAGTSSSSALNIAWTRFVLELAGKADLIPESREIARLAYLAEVEEFGEPGGMMDHYASAVGGILFLDFDEPVKITELSPRLGHFVLGDSVQPKDTLTILKRVKQGVLAAVQRIQQVEPEFQIKTFPEDELGRFRNLFSPAEFDVLHGAVLNRDITREGLKLVSEQQPDAKMLGRLLSEHHRILDRMQGISTGKINRMLDAAIRAGAMGGKINGSGGGGCMFVYAPDDPERAAHAIEQEGGKAYIMHVDPGVRVEAE